MQKLLLLSILFLSSLFISAQSVLGTWMSEKSLDKYLTEENSFLADEEVKAPIFIEFGVNDINVGVYLIGEEEGMHIELLITIPGTYTQTDNLITTNLHKTKLTTKLVDFSTEDPELKSLLSSGDEAKELVLQMLESQLSEGFKEIGREYRKLAPIFSEFSVQFIPNNPDKMILISPSLKTVTLNRLQ